MVDKVQLITEPRAPTPAQPAAPSRTTTSGPGFDAVLREKLGEGTEVRFSAHAQGRLRSRNIELSSGQMERLNAAAAKAAEKGARETLLLMDNLGFIVSVPNRTVVTAVEPNEGQDAVFTNIDSTVIVGGAQASGVVA